MGLKRTLGWWKKVGWRHFFKFDLADHHTFLGGYMGTAHALVTVLVLCAVWYFTRFMSPRIAVWLMLAGLLSTSFWWYKRESKNFTTTPWRPRSTKEVTLDTRLDFVLQLVLGLIIFGSWVYIHRVGLFQWA